MNFREFVLNEQDPMGMAGAPMGDPMGGGMGGPPMGGAPPMGDPMGGGMGDPMGGGMGGPPMGGEQEPPPIPQYANVWDVLDSILNHKPLDHEQQKQQQDQQGGGSAGDNPGGSDPAGVPGGLGMDGNMAMANPGMDAGGAPPTAGPVLMQ